jgi:glycosyltransferase involved in cell wall biosynthesis
MAFARLDRPTLCHVLHGLQVGGAEILAARLARRCSADFRVVFICLDELGTLGQELRGEGFAVHVMDRKPGLDWLCLKRLGQIFRRERVDVIHAHQYTPFFYAMLGRWLSGRPPILFTEHGRHFPDRRRPKRVLANRLLLARRDRVVGVGQAVRRAVIANEGIAAGRVGVVYNGIDLARFQGQACDRREARTELGMDAADLMILQVARLDYLKDHLTALRALKRILPILPQARLVLVGDGPRRALIQEAIADCGLAAHVRMLGTRQDVGRLSTAADIFLLTSISEGIPLTLIEAMAAGLPVVATRVGGVPEVIDEGVTGFLAPAGDDAALAGHIVHLASDHGLREDMGRRGHYRAKTLFSENQMVARYDALYRDMLAQAAQHA